LINLSKDKPILLIKEHDIGSSIKRSFDNVLAFYNANVPSVPTSKNAPKINLTLNFFSHLGTLFLNKVDMTIFEKLISSTIREVDYDSYSVLCELLGGDVTAEKIGLRKRSKIESYGGRGGINDLFRIVLIDLWVNKIAILPLSTSAPFSKAAVFFKYIDSLNCPILKKLWNLHPHSLNPVASNLDRVKLSKSVSHQCRLILNTDFHVINEISDKDLYKLYDLKGDSYFSRYYISEFLFQVCSLDEDTLTRLNSVQQERDTVVKTVSGKKRIESLANSDRSKWKPRKDGRIIEKEIIQWNRATYLKHKDTSEIKSAKKYFIKQNQMVDYALGDLDLTIDEFVERFFASNTYKKSLYIEDIEVSKHPLYGELPQKVQHFIHILWLSCRSFTKSKRNQRDNDVIYMTNVMLLYVGVYLPRFYMEVDGNLDRYPTCFNEFECGLYFARDEYLEKLIHGDDELPITLLDFIKHRSIQQEWSNDTHFGKVVQIRQYAEYIETNSNIIPNTNNFKSTITDSDMPLTSKRHTTVKKFISRKYFQTLISLLESMDYMVEHLNGMADGFNFARVGGNALQKASHYELREGVNFSGIWGKQGQRKPYVDLDALNYTPIILHEEKYYPIKTIRRFYKIVEYKINGVNQTRVAPHTPRISWLMCNTGIRQQHLIWLDKDRFDGLVTKGSDAALQPLLVNTDKSHSEWVSVTSSEVIELCRKQRKWYDKCELEEFKEDIWYGHKEGSRFGQFQPLFRLATSDKTWNIYTEFPKVLLTLQLFFQEQLGDTDFPELVEWKPTKKELFDGDANEHTLTHNEYLKNEHNISWGYELSSEYTPHGLRAGFVSDAIKFLPPSLIGRHLTGQSEKLVWYYAIMDETGGEDHQQLLLNLLLKNAESIEGGDAPEITKRMVDLNLKLAKDIEVNPIDAIKDHSLISLAGVNDGVSGIDILIAKKHGVLALNPTHICPFNNTCPSEVVKKFGLMKPCALCPYSIRGRIHLRAISAEKFKNKELVKEYTAKIKAYKKRPKKGQIPEELEKLEAHVDHTNCESAALEAIEKQLVHLNNTNSDGLIVQNKDDVIGFIKAIEMDESDYVLKRLCDAQIFPDTTTSSMQRKFAYLRHKLVKASGKNLDESDFSDEEEHVLITSQIKSMMAINGLSVKDIYNIAKNEQKIPEITSPVMKNLGIEFNSKPEANND